MWIALLILHGLLALLLIGAITHQAVSVAWPSPRKRRFVESFAAVRSAFYTNAIVIMYIVTFVIGAWIYADYRINVKPTLEDSTAHVPVGLFELKEHFVAVGLLILPVYWLFWKKIALSEQIPARIWLTMIIAFCTWFSFFIGHIVNNVRGLGT